MRQKSHLRDGAEDFSINLQLSVSLNLEHVAKIVYDLAFSLAFVYRFHTLLSLCFDF